MLENLILGGPLMIPLLFESVLALAIMIDRFLAFRANSRVDSRALRSRVLAQMAQGQVKEAAELCASTPGPVSAVMLAGLQAYQRHQNLANRPETLRVLVADAMDEYATRAIAQVEKGLSILSFVGNSAPLFGMTGTVTGMIAAFTAMGEASNLDPSIVAVGISEALVTTASGLIIAIGAVIPFHYFTSKVNAIDAQIAEASSEVLDFVMLTHGEGDEAQAAASPAAEVAAG